MNNQDDIIETTAKLLGSYLLFTRTFFYLRTGREFIIPNPPGRYPHIYTVAETLTDVYHGRKRNVIINVPPRYGKAIDVNTPMLTQDGWTIAGDVKVGDKLVGSKGWTIVEGVYHQGIVEAKRVIFSDNQSIVCNDDHLWNVCDRYTPTFKTKTTREIEDTICEADGRKHWRIPMIDGNYGEIEPFIDPYLFGCWLGDGHSHYSAITTMDEDIVKAFRDHGHTLRPHTHQSAGKAITYGIINNGFSKLLRENGLLHNKHIPQSVYRWSKENRLALLQGMMDTDGGAGKNGQVSFSNTKNDLIKGLGYLVNSLGGIYRICLINRLGNPEYSQLLSLRLPEGMAPFRLKRKLERISQGIKCAPRRFIADIVEEKPVEMVCFKVDAEDSLFAAGEGLILTHNTELLIHFIAWSMARNNCSNFLYVSYSHELASKQTGVIKQIIEMPHYQKLFDVRIRQDSRAKDNFETTVGGSVYAAGTGGTITGRGAGIKGYDGFGGCVVIDDSIKPDEATSDTVRARINEWFDNTLMSRLNQADKTPIIFIGQRVHEDDLANKLIETGKYHLISIPALDLHDNPLQPEMHTREMLLDMKKTMPYVFASQYQQDPIPAGGGIFKTEWFKLLDDEPEILMSFITVDTAETDKTYNDATVFSFWGLYKIKIKDVETELYGLHWLDCQQLWCEPADLESEFFAFYADCMRHIVKPSEIVIEKKSTGTTLSSVLSRIQGLRIVAIERTKASGSKTTRYLEMQPFVASKQISLPSIGKHTRMCIEHMGKITANNTHRNDDICDTAFDACKLALIDKTLLSRIINKPRDAQIARRIMSSTNQLQAARRRAYGKSNK